MDFYKVESEFIDSLDFLSPPVKREQTSGDFYGATAYNSKTNKIHLYLEQQNKFTNTSRNVLNCKRTIETGTESSTSLTLKNTSDKELLERYSVVSCTSFQESNLNLETQYSKQECKPLIKVTVIPKTEENHTAKLLRKRRRIPKRVQSTLSNLDNSLRTKNLYLVVSGRRKDKIYEIQTSGSATLFTDQTDTSSNKNEDISLEELTNVRTLIQSLDMDHNRHKESKDYKTDAPQQTTLANTYNAKQCLCSNMYPSGKSPSNRSRVKIFGQLGLTEDERYILRYGATVNDKPVSDFAQLKTGFAPGVVPPAGCTRSYENIPEYKKDAGIQPSYEHMFQFQQPSTPSYFVSNIRCQPPSTECQATQVDFNIQVTSSRNYETMPTSDKDIQCSYMNVEKLPDYRRPEGCATDCHSPLVIISVYPKSSPEDINKPENSSKCDQISSNNKRGTSPPAALASNTRRQKIDKEKKINDTRRNPSKENKFNTNRDTSARRRTPSPPPPKKPNSRLQEKQIETTVLRAEITNNPDRYKAMRAIKEKILEKNKSDFQTTSKHTATYPKQTNERTANKTISSPTEEKGTNTEHAMTKKVLVDSYTKQLTEHWKHREPVPAKLDRSKVTVNIEGSNEYYDLLLGQDRLTTDLIIRKTMKEMSTQMNECRKKSPSLENLVILTDKQNRKEQSAQRFSGVTIRDSLEICHRREDKNYGNVKTQTNQSPTRIEDSTVDLEFLAPIKHYTGDDCPLTDPVERDKQIRELLGVDKSKVITPRSQQAHSSENDEYPYHCFYRKECEKNVAEFSLVKFCSCLHSRRKKVAKKSAGLTHCSHKQCSKDYLTDIIYGDQINVCPLESITSKISKEPTSPEAYGMHKAYGYHKYTLENIASYSNVLETKAVQSTLQYGVQKSKEIGTDDVRQVYLHNASNTERDTNYRISHSTTGYRPSVGTCTPLAGLQIAGVPGYRSSVTAGRISSGLLGFRTPVCPEPFSPQETMLCKECEPDPMCCSQPRNLCCDKRNNNRWNQTNGWNLPDYERRDPIREPNLCKNSPQASAIIQTETPVFNKPQKKANKKKKSEDKLHGCKKVNTQTEAKIKSPQGSGYFSSHSIFGKRHKRKCLPEPCKKSPSPPHRSSPTPPRQRSPSPPRPKSSTPPRQRSTSPPCKISPTPPRRRSPSPPRQKSSTPPRRRSPSPPRQKSSTPPRRRSPSPPCKKRSTPARRRSPSPPHRRSPSPPRRRSPSPPPQKCPKPSRKSPKPSRKSPKPSRKSPKPSRKSPKPSRKSPLFCRKSSLFSRKSSKPSRKSPKPSQKSPKPSQKSPKPSRKSSKPSCKSPPSTPKSPPSPQKSPPSSPPSTPKSPPSPRKSSPPAQKSPPPPRKSTPPPLKSTPPPRKSQPLPRKCSASPRKSHPSPRKSPPSPRKSPPPPRKSPPSPRKSPPSPRKSPPTPRKSPPSPRKSSSSCRKSPPPARKPAPTHKTSPPVHKTPPPPRKTLPPPRKTSPPARKSPPPARKSPPPARKSPPPARKSPPPARKTPVSVRKSPRSVRSSPTSSQKSSLSCRKSPQSSRKTQYESPRQRSPLPTPPCPCAGADHLLYSSEIKSSRSSKSYSSLSCKKDSEKQTNKGNVENSTICQQLILNRNIQVFLQIEKFCKKRPILLSRKQYDKVKKTIKSTVGCKSSKDKRKKIQKKSSESLVSVGEVRERCTPDCRKCFDQQMQTETALFNKAICCKPHKKATMISKVRYISSLPQGKGSIEMQQYKTYDRKIDDEACKPTHADVHEISSILQLNNSDEFYIPMEINYKKQRRYDEPKEYYPRVEYSHKRNEKFWRPSEYHSRRSYDCRRRPGEYFRENGHHYRTDSHRPYSCVNRHQIKCQRTTGACTRRSEESCRVKAELARIEAEQQKSREACIRVNVVEQNRISTGLNAPNEELCKAARLESREKKHSIFNDEDHTICDECHIVNENLRSTKDKSARNQDIFLESQQTVYEAKPSLCFGEYIRQYRENPVIFGEKKERMKKYQVSEEHQNTNIGNQRPIEENQRSTEENKISNDRGQNLRKEKQTSDGFQISSEENEMIATEDNPKLHYINKPSKDTPASYKNISVKRRDKSGVVLRVDGEKPMVWSRDQRILQGNHNQWDLHQKEDKTHYKNTEEWPRTRKEHYESIWKLICEDYHNKVTRRGQPYGGHNEIINEHVINTSEHENSPKNRIKVAQHSRHNEKYNRNFKENDVLRSEVQAERCERTELVKMCKDDNKYHRHYNVEVDKVSNKHCSKYNACGRNSTEYADRNQLDKTQSVILYNVTNKSTVDSKPESLCSKKTVSSMEIHYTSVTYMKHIDLSSSNVAVLSDSSVEHVRSFQTIFRGNRKCPTPNLGTSAYSLYTDDGINSDKSPKIIEPRDEKVNKKPFLMRLMSCLVTRTTRPSALKLPTAPAQDLPVVNSSVDSYHISTSLGAIEVSSSIYDTSASFYSNHTILPLNSKIKRGFFNSVRGFLTNKRS